MEKLDEYADEKVEYMEKRERLMREEFIGPKTKKRDEDHQRKFEQFLDSQRSYGEKVKRFLETGNKQVKFDQFKTAVHTKNVPGFYSDLHEKNDYLDEYKRYEYYQNNYISKREGVELQKQDENKLRKRAPEESIRHSIQNFFDTLDEDFRPSIKKNPVSLKAKVLDKIQKDANDDRVFSQYDLMMENQEELRLNPMTDENRRAIEDLALGVDYYEQKVIYDEELSELGVYENEEKIKEELEEEDEIEEDEEEIPDPADANEIEFAKQI